MNINSNATWDQVDSYMELEKQKKQLNKDIAYVKKFIDYIIAGYGRKACTHKRKLELHPDCGNCQAQWAIGWIRNHLSLLEWELQELRKTRAELKATKQGGVLVRKKN